jgi:putative membrane protein
MKIRTVIKRDLRTNFRDKIKLLSLLVAVLLPLAYGFLYLWAFWNPYENMKNVPVAVVNEDMGTIYEGKEENFGNRITDELKKNQVLKWEFVKNDEATSGLDNQKYYAIIDIPADFSTNLTSAGSDNPQQAKISWRTHDSTNFLFTTYLKNINEEVLPEFSTQAGKKVVELSGKLDEASDGAKDLSSGLGRIRDGSDTLHNSLGKADSGAKQLTSGLETLDSKSADLNGGIEKAKEGSAVLKSGLESARSGTNSLDSGLAKLSAGASELKNGTSQTVSGTRALANGAGEMSDKIQSTDASLSPFYPYLDNLSSQIDKTNTDQSLNIPNLISSAKEQKNELISGSKQIADGSETLAEKTVKIDEGAGNLKNGIDSAKTGADTLQSGISKLSEGSDDLNSGLIDIYDGSQQYTRSVNSAYGGAEQLSSGLTQMTDGSGKITDGIVSARNGANTLNLKLSEGSSQLKGELGTDKIRKLITIVNEPIVMENDSDSATDTYGAGFAPYFIPLALWMGALILTLLVPTRDPKLKLSGISRIEMTLGKFFLLGAIGVCQAVTLSLSIIYGLGMNVRYPLRLILFCILISLTFISIMQFLSFTFGKIGELLGIVFLMIQLTSASGTFPVQSAPRFFQICNPLVPMTYAIRGLRLFILGGQMHIAAEQALVLGSFMIIFLGLKTLITKKTVSATDIYPLIEL